MSIKDQLNTKRQRSYLNRDFDSLRSALQQYAQTYYSDRISDFSESGVGGLFLDMAAYVGDVMSYYMDHQFNELDITTAVERSNIIRLVRNAGVKISGASPATVTADIFFQVSATNTGNVYTPNVLQLPVVKSGTQAVSNTGIVFELLEDIDFAEVDEDGELKAQYKSATQDTRGNPRTFLVKRSGLFTSSVTRSETYSIPDTFVPFRRITLDLADVTEILSVRDSEGNEYYEVDFLTNDVVYKRVSRSDSDTDAVPESISLQPAPYRFTSSLDIDTGLTTIQFGSGDADTLDNDIIPDPSEVSVPLYGQRKTFSDFTLDPGTLLRTKTLGISPRNTSITVTYRSGGGITHNIDAGTLRTFSNLVTAFPESLSLSTVAAIRSTSDINNPSAAAGGESALTLDELKTQALSYRNAQSRIVTKEDLIARIYTMPPNFGRVYRVGVRSNENNPLSSIVAIISRNSNGRLVNSPDALKKNLALYINQYRLISDGIDIVDASVINFYVKYAISVDNGSNKSAVLQNVSSRLANYFNIANFQIDQPLIVSEMMSLILDTDGVVSLTDLQVLNRSGNDGGREYSSVQFDFVSNTRKGIIQGPPGSIFEMRYPGSDIIGAIV